MTSRTIPRSVFVDGRKWVDRTYGNSYFSVRVYVDGDEVARVPFTYGYGSMYEQAAAGVLRGLGVLPSDPTTPLSRLVRESGADYYASLRRVTRRECAGWGEPPADYVTCRTDGGAVYARRLTAEEVAGL